MGKIIMNGFTVHGVESCPSCGSETPAWVNGHWRFVEMHCNSCDYRAPGGLILHAVSQAKNPEAFKEQTRVMLNHWNEEVAKEEKRKPQKVRIRKSKVFTEEELEQMV